VARAEGIARSIVVFARLHGATEAWFESPAYSRNTSMHTLGALYGVVALELVRAGVSIQTAPMASARKLLLGKVPRKDVKVAVYGALRAAGARFETMDESDAMCVANFAMVERGGYALIQEAS
jgi:Holliday junction resolvasome RuvABC endonuclease subunit